MSSPTARSLAECRKRGWEAQVVERWNQYARRRIDLFGVIDLLAIQPVRLEQGGWYQIPVGAGIVGIQACAGASHAARKAKILAEPRAKAWIEAGGRLEVWSWTKKGKKGVRKLWKLREEAIGIEDFR